MEYKMEGFESKTLEFIEEYYNAPALWQTSNKLYTNRLARKEALLKISQRFGIGVKEVLRKIKSLRSYFHREHSKVLKAQSGLFVEGASSSHWFAYRPLLFILEGCEARKPRRKSIKAEIEDVEISTVQEGTNIDNQEGTDIITQEGTDTNALEDHAYYYSADRNRNDSIAEPEKKKLRRIMSLSNKPVEKPVEVVVQASSNGVEKEDHFTFFSNYLASRMRRLRNPYLQSLAEQRINDLMSDVERMTHRFDGSEEDDGEPSSGSASQTQILINPEYLMH